MRELLGRDEWPDLVVELGRLHPVEPVGLPCVVGQPCGEAPDAALPGQDGGRLGAALEQRGHELLDRLRREVDSRPSRSHHAT